jgi:apolipoprotein N-acyltransferase
LVLPAAWGITEWVRGWMFTGFPWLVMGYSQSPYGPLSGYAPLVGAYGISWLVASSAGLLLWTLTRWQAAGVRAATIGAAAFAALWLAGAGLQQMAWTSPARDPVSVSLVQGNIKQDIKWRPEWIQASLDRYLQLTRSARGQLILLPETAIPLFTSDVPPGYLDALADHARVNGGGLLTGIPEAAGSPPRYFNSVISLGTEQPQVYRKYHLVPFGDYFPQWGFISWIMGALDIPMSAFSRGEAYQEPMSVGGEQIAVNICYEDAFGEEIVRQLPKATMLANFTNDAWWGESLASDQHFQMAQLRAQETGRYMLRATNTGVTAIIDQRGRVIAQAPQFTETVLEGQARGFTGATPYVWWANWPFLALCVVPLVVLPLRSYLGKRALKRHTDDGKLA